MSNTLGFGLDVNRGGAGYKYQSETVTLLRALTGTYSTPRKIQIDKLIKSLKTAGIWSKLDVLQMYAAPTAADAVVNWKSPGTFNATLVNSPTLAADRGITGDGASSYINSGYTPSLGTNFLQDSASFGVSINNLSSSTGFEAHGARNTTWNSSRFQTYLRYPTDFNGAYGVGLNSDDGIRPSATPSNGHFAINRIINDKVEYYKNGSKAGADATLTSNGVTNQVLYILGVRDAPGGLIFPSNDRAAIMFAGAGMNGTEMAALSTALETYLDYIGAGVI